MWSSKTAFWPYSTVSICTLKPRQCADVLTPAPVELSRGWMLWKIQSSISIFITVDVERVGSRCSFGVESDNGDSVGNTWSVLEEQATWDLRGFTVKRQDLSEPLALQPVLLLHVGAPIGSNQKHRTLSIHRLLPWSRLCFSLPSLLGDEHSKDSFYSETPRSYLSKT